LWIFEKSTFSGRRLIMSIEEGFDAVDEYFAPINSKARSKLLGINDDADEEFEEDTSYDCETFTFDEEPADEF
jgi:hypothetical protein